MFSIGFDTMPILTLTKRSNRRFLCQIYLWMSLLVYKTTLLSMLGFCCEMVSNVMKVLSICLNQLTTIRHVVLH